MYICNETKENYIIGWHVEWHVIHPKITYMYKKKWYVIYLRNYGLCSIGYFLVGQFVWEWDSTLQRVKC